MIKLNAQHLMSQLHPQSLSFIRQIHVFNELDSTNTWLLERKGCGEVCLAESQFQGRGRRGRFWSSPDAGNIYLSMSWCFDPVPELFSLISLIVGTSLCEVLDKSGLRGHSVKWPNDILINQQKIAGILIETSGSSQRVVIGIGLNLYADNKHQTQLKNNGLSGQTIKQIEQPWCSLDQVMDKVPERDDLVVAIINNLTDKMSRFGSLAFSEFMQQWKQWDITYNQPVIVFQGGQRINGVAKGINDKGHILVKLENHVIKNFHSAEVSLRC